MSDYEPQEWYDRDFNTPASAERLNHIEDGIRNHGHPGSTFAAGFGDRLFGRALGLVVPDNSFFAVVFDWIHVDPSYSVAPGSTQIVAAGDYLYSYTVRFSGGNSTPHIRLALPGEPITFSSPQLASNVNPQTPTVSGLATDLTPGYIETLGIRSGGGAMTVDARFDMMRVR